MKVKQTKIVVGMPVLLVISFSRCTEKNKDQPNENGNGNGATGNTFTMNAEELLNDMNIETDYATYMKTDFISMQEVDSLIFMDAISEIQYLTDVDATEIVFTIKIGETEWKSTRFFFMGNITDSYKVGDFVRITVTITHATFTIDGMDVDIEIYKETWLDFDYYQSHRTTSTGGFYPMPTGTITKIYHKNLAFIFIKK